MAIVKQTFPVGLYQCNCSIIYCDKTLEAIIIDPGSEPETIVAKVESKGLKVKYLLHTHAHLDHFGATSKVKEKCSAVIGLHKADEFLYNLHEQQSAMLGLPQTTISTIDHYIQDNEEFTFGEGQLKTLFTPGHTPGSISFSLEIGSELFLFSGDTLFNGGIGRTDFPGGDSELIVKSIKDRLYTLDGDCRVIPGHGDETLIGKEKRSNPFVRA
ncbi:MAG: MBL fold metallo-hydrolase [Lentisphaeraceae bacterium]|nr:MBL fold metallo-hydrolase [Lentisphaeraceae bacterium]